jgi:hypothetical protein
MESKGKSFISLDLPVSPYVAHSKECLVEDPPKASNFPRGGVWGYLGPL